MNKQGLINAVAKKLDIAKKDATPIVEGVFEVVLEGLVAEGEVSLGDLGKLQVVERKERNGVNPQTKEKIVIAAKKAPKFKPSKLMKESVK